MRRTFLAPLALLALALCAVIAFGSPYAPAVGAYREIEEQWAIEDEREESAEPLVTRLFRAGSPLPYDEATDTFYCPLPLGDAEGTDENGWPALELAAPDKGVTLFYADDYSFDARASAQADGTPYLLMAYTDEAFHYSQLVFTGLPALSLTVEQEITPEDAPAAMTYTGAGGGAVSAPCRVHRRGASTLYFGDKAGYRVEFTRHTDGKKKVSCELPGFGLAEAVVLLPMGHDETMMRDRLSWDLFALLAGEGEPYGPRRTAYVELFLDGSYEGVYLMMEPYDAEAELMKTNSTLTDAVYRTAALNFSQGRLYERHPLRDNAGYELYYAPMAGHEFDALAGYLDLITEQDDAKFLEKAYARTDVDSMLRHVLLIQAGGMTDNVFNNLYIWAHREGGGYRYRFAPWDMDMTWGLKKDEIGEEYENWLYFPLADRMLDLDEDLRARLYGLWQDYKARAFNMDVLDALLEGYREELADSGAMYRNAERWGTEIYIPDPTEIQTFAALRFDLIDAAIETIANSPGARVPFLSGTNYVDKGGPITGN